MSDEDRVFQVGGRREVIVHLVRHKNYEPEREKAMSRFHETMDTGDTGDTGLRLTGKIAAAQKC